MRLTIAELKKLLVSTMELVAGLSPRRVILEGHNGPRPSSGLYCSLWFKDLDLLPQNVGDYTQPEQATDQAVQTLRHETYCTVQISFWGPKAFDATVAASQELHTDARWSDLWRVLGYGGTGPVQDISAAFGGQVQGRAFFDLSFYACFGTDYPVDWFDTSQWAVRYAGQQEEFPYSKEIADEPKRCCVS